MGLIRYTETAKSDLRHIFDYIGADSKKYAKRHISSLKNEISRLADYPQIGRVVPEFGNEKIRELIFRDYRIVYLTENEDAIYILTIFHGSRLLY